MKNVVRFRLDILGRVFADIVTLSLCTCTAILLQFLVLETSSQTRWQTAVQYFLPSICVVLPVGISVFALLGLYTRTRGYPMWSKIIGVSQAVAVSFILVGLARIFLAPLGLLPGRSIIFAWLFTWAVTLTGRMWARFWSYLVLTDNNPPAVLVHKVQERSVLLIGGAGYIGSALLPQLLTRGYKVRLVDSFVYGDQPIAEWIGHKQLEIFRADFRQVDKIVEAMQGMGSVIHLGAIVGDPACALNEELTIEVNLVATRMIAEVAKGEGVSRFLFASTCSVYGRSDATLDETSPLNPVSLYARSKIACEQVLLGLGDNSFSPIILRFGTIYGLSGRTRFDLVVNLLAAKALVDGEMTVFGSDQWRPFVHVQDAAWAVLLALNANPSRSRKTILNVGSDEQNLTLGDVGRMILQVVPSAKLRYIEHGVDKRNYRVNFRRIREELGFEPKWSIEEGIEQVLDAVRTGRVTDYLDPKYSNVKFLTEDGRDMLKVQNGWAHELIYKPWFHDVEGVGAVIGSETMQNLA